MSLVMLLPGAGRITPAATRRERFRSAVAALFLEMARWPTVRDVERLLERRGDPIDAQREAKRLCRSLGRVRGDRIILTVRGLHLAKPKNPVLRGFKEGLDLALERFQGGDLTTEPTLSIEDLMKRASLGRKQATCVMALMASEGLVVAGDGGDTSTIAARVRRFRSVETIPEYIAEQSTADRRRCVKQVASGRGRAVSIVLDRRAVAAIVRSAAGILLAALVLWLGGLLFPSGDEKPHPQVPKSTAPDKPPAKPTAASPPARNLYSRRSAAARSGG